MVQWFKKILKLIFKQESQVYLLDFDIEKLKSEMSKNYTYLYDVKNSDGFRLFLDQIIKARNVQIVEISRQGKILKDQFELGKQLGRLEVLNDIISGIEISFSAESDKRNSEKKVPLEKKVFRESGRRIVPAI